MILVTGGCFQGKTDYACETFHIAKEEAADGMDCPMEAIYETKLLYHFHEYIKRCMEANQELDLLSGGKEGIRSPPGSLRNRDGDQAWLNLS